MNNLFNSYDSENDERLDKKFSYNYQVIKNAYPQVSKLPEDEVRESIRQYYDATGTHEESMQAVMNYIHEKEPEWKRLYFNKEDEQTHKFNGMEMIDKLLNYLPEYKTLKDAKQEMDRINMAGYDNYAHRLAMCRIGQMGASGSILSPGIGLGLGVLKEAKDIYDKSIKNDRPWKETLQDSWKDMRNNWEGLNWGLNNPDENCRIWLNDLDYQTNRWRK